MDCQMPECGFQATATIRARELEPEILENPRYRGAADHRAHGNAMKGDPSGASPSHGRLLAKPFGRSSSTRCSGGGSTRSSIRNPDRRCQAELRHRRRFTDALREFTCGGDINDSVTSAHSRRFRDFRENWMSAWSDLVNASGVLVTMLKSMPWSAPALREVRAPADSLFDLIDDRTRGASGARVALLAVAAPPRRPRRWWHVGSSGARCGVAHRERTTCLPDERQRGPRTPAPKGMRPLDDREQNSVGL